MAVVKSRMNSQLLLLPFLLFLSPGAMGYGGPPDMAALTLYVEQIGEIMMVCKENPSFCSCEDGSLLPGNNLFGGLMSCKPTTCECPDGLIVPDLDKIIVEEVLTPEMFGRVMSLGGFMGAWSKVERYYHGFCEGNAPVSCTCENGDLITDFEKSVSELFSCRAVSCECSDGALLEVPDIMRISFLSHMDTICDVEACGCFASSKVLAPPFESVSEFEDCAPETCICRDGSSKVMPALPEMEENLIQAFDEIAADRLSRLGSLCSGQAPKFCECVRTEEVLTSFGDEEQVDNCYPRLCHCLDGSVLPAPNRRGSFTHVVRLMDLKYGKEESVKLTKFFGYNKYRPYASKSP